MKIHTPPLRASHLNTGTSVPHDELPWPATSGRVMRAPKLHVEVDERSTVTKHGGIDLALQLFRRFKVARKIDDAVKVLKIHLPYHESDHVLAQALNLYAGGTCLEDMANLQNSEAILRMTGACRLPDPTTSGDFLRRFQEHCNPGAYAALCGVVDDVQREVWRAVAKRHGRRRKKRDWAVVDVDGHVKELYGVQKEEADFSYKGKWSYQPLVISLAGVNECLHVMNRPGNARSCDGAPEALDEVLPRVNEAFKNTLVRADSDFDTRQMRQACERHGAYFAFVGREFPDRPRIADSIPEEAWKPFRTRAARDKEERRKRPDFKPRRKKRNERHQRAQERNYQELRLVNQWVAEVSCTPAGSDKACRLVIRRQLIEHHQGQQFLFEKYRYRYIVTDLPSSWSAEDVIDETYERCDQENLIEQMGSGIAAWRMPVAEFDGNCAWLEIGRLAWNVGKWLAQLALPAETVRWEWKRFRAAFVDAPATIIKRGRQTWVRFSDSHRFTQTLVSAHRKLQT